MLRRQTILLIMAGMMSFTTAAQAKTSIFACEPEWASLAKEIGGDFVKVKLGTNAHQDPHFISVRPSLIAMVRKTDMVFCNGADLEIGWLPILLLQSGNSRVQPGTNGYFMAADYVHKLEVPTSVDRALGDVHPMGNPHIVGDPRNIAIVARAFAARLAVVDPENKLAYEKQLARFEDRWLASLIKWNARAKPLKGLPIIIQHKTWVYLVHWLGLDVVSTLELRPGIPPSTSHLQTILNDLPKAKPKFIINAAYENNKPSIWLSQRAGIPDITLPFTVGGTKNSDDLFALYDTTISLLLEHAE